MQISDILAAERVAGNLSLSSKKTALEVLADLLASASLRLSREEVFDCLLSRERLGDTGLGNGIALPHGRMKNAHFTVAAFIKLERGVDYDAADQQPVDLLFALLVPEESTDEHLQILARLAEMFSKQEFLDRLRREDSEAALYELLTG